MKVAERGAGERRSADGVLCYIVFFFLFSQITASVSRPLTNGYVKYFNLLCCVLKSRKHTHTQNPITPNIDSVQVDHIIFKIHPFYTKL